MPTGPGMNRARGRVSPVLAGAVRQLCGYDGVDFH
jgi:hypothetical protein